MYDVIMDSWEYGRHHKLLTITDNYYAIIIIYLLPLIDAIVAKRFMSVLLIKSNAISWFFNALISQFSLFELKRFD